MKFLFDKIIKLKKSNISNILKKCEDDINFTASIDETKEDNYELLIEDGIDQTINLNLYLPKDIKATEAEKQIISIVGYYYV